MRYSEDLRQRVRTFVGSGGSKAEASRRFAVCPKTVFNWLKDTAPAAKPGPKMPRVDMDKLTKMAKARPDALLDEHASVLRVHPSTVYRRLRALGLTQKKRGSSPK